MFVTPLAQGFLDEEDPRFGGLYAGSGSHPGVQEFVEDSDLVLHLGSLETDVTTYMGTAKLKRASTVKLYTDRLEIGYASFPNVHIRATILAILEGCDFTGVSIKPFKRLENGSSNGVPNATDDNPAITHDWLWPYLGHWLRPNDILLTDTGTASFGIFDTKLPSGSMLINTSLWASIGYSLPSSQGAALAAKERNGGQRTILFQGDGSFQLTCQEISTMVKERLKVFMSVALFHYILIRFTEHLCSFIICNRGYTIEREVHDTSEAYNDIATWDHQAILPVFDPKSQHSRAFRVETKSQLDSLLADGSFLSFNGVQVGQTTSHASCSELSLYNR